MIGPDDRISRVIASDERLIDVLADLSPAFERLRNPGMRRVMARLVTVRQAARIAGVDEDEMLRRLNGALAGAPGESNETTRTGATMMEGTGGPKQAVAEARSAPPPELGMLPPERIVDLDVREDLRNGREPFSRIMAARKELAEDAVLRLRAVFEPVPLYGVMRRHGFGHWTERLDDEDWRVWFYRPNAGQAVASAEAAEPSAATPEEGAGEEARADGRAGAGGGDSGDVADDVIALDVRGLEPPEPMVRTLEALEGLPAGATLVQVNVRVPKFLLPQLDERGFTYEVREESADLVRLFIRRRADD